MKTFLDWLAFEVKQQQVKYIAQHINAFNRHATNKLHLSTIFPGKTKRLLIPLTEPDQDIQTLLAKLTPPDFTLADLQQGFFHQKITTKQGHKTRKVNIGTFLQRYHPELVTAWSRAKAKLQNHNANDSYSIIISRYPLDIMRMSDHVDEEGKQISSCHSPTGSYFRCAKEEARTGGAVAYLVKTQDLNSSIPNLQAKEIFKDKDRQKEGIIPQERLRLRRFTNKEGAELLIPELRSYVLGRQHGVPGFKEAVLAWAKHSQQPLLSQLLHDPQKAFREFSLRGGAYQDTNAGKIWKEFFGVNNIKLSGKKNSQDQTDTGQKAIGPEEWLHIADQSYAQHRRRWMTYTREISVSYAVNHVDEETGQASGKWHAFIDFAFAENIFTVKKPPLPPSSFYDTTAADDYKTFVNELRTKLSRVYGGLFDQWQVRYQKSDSSYLIQGFNKKHPEEEGNLDEFEAFLDNLDAIDKNYVETKQFLLNAFKDMNLVKNDITDLYQQYNNNSHKRTSSSPWQVFNLAAGAGGEYTLLESPRMALGDLQGLPSNPDIVSVAGGRLSLPWRDLLYHHHLYPPLPQFVNFKDNLLFMVMPDNQGYHLNQKAQQKQPFTKEDGIVSLELYFPLTHADPLPKIKKIMAGTKHIDANWQAYVQKLQQWWLNVKQLLMNSPHQLPYLDMERRYNKSATTNPF